MISTSQRDLYKYYNSSWLGYRADGVTTPILVQGVTDDSEFRTGIGRIHYQDPYLDYEYPDLGMLRLQDRVYYCTRTPARQWIKGVRPSHLQMTDVLTQRTVSLTNFNTSVQKDVLSRLYNNELQGVQRLAAKVNGDVYYRTKKVEDAVLDNPALKYIKDYILVQELEDIQCG